VAEIIVVDDDPKLCRMLADALGMDGRHRVRRAADGTELRGLLTEAPADMVILDVGLPGEDGFRLARWLRERHDPGIVMLTGADTVIDRVAGLETGADDYLAKPCSLAELKARIEAVLRRRLPPGGDRLPDGVVRFGPYRFDRKRFALTDTAGADVPLAPMELDLVAAFALHPAKALSREDLMRLAPPRGEEGFDRSIDSRVNRLRRKLETDPAKPELIKTLHGAGYIHPG
jgi:two-component system, OmpR family, response regulator